jgi:hypothetical protein
VTDNLRFVSHPAVWHNRAALASLMAESLSDVTTRRYQGCRPKCGWNSRGAISGNMKLSVQAARSIG